MFDNDNFVQKELNDALLNFKNAKYDEAIVILEKLKKKQSHFIINWYLGHSYFRIYDYSSAINCIKKSIELKKPDNLNLSFLAEIYLHINDYKEAIRLFKEVLKIDNNNINSLLRLARAYLDLGEFEKAKKYYTKIIQNEFDNFEAQYELTKIDKNYLTKDLLKEIEKNKITSKTNYLNHIYSKFIQAEYYKNQKNYKEEFKSLLEAHETYLEKNQKAADQEFNYFSNLLPKFMSKVKNIKFELNCNLKPIFIMGLPRSGTTLIENIISSSKNKIEPGSETGVLSQIFFSKKIILNYDSLNLDTNFNFEKNDFENLKRLILKQYDELSIDTKKKVFIDKSLENILYIDLVSKIFPNAKFVYCTRNKHANLLGIMKVFLPNIFWSHSIKKIISIMNLYNKKIEEIISENKIKIKIIELEKFSENPTKFSKDLFNYLELDWHDRILSDRIDSKRLIKTVSNLQVRKKISKHNLSYLDNYLHFLKDFKIEKLI